MSERLPSFADARARLPSPVYDEDPACVECYWKAWEIAFRNFHEPTPGSGFVSQFIDAAFNQNIFQWDTCFMTMFCNYGHPHVPGIRSLDNFYAKQHKDGEICREIDRTTGKDFAPWVNAEGEPLFSRWGFHVSVKGGLTKMPIRYVGREAPAPHPVLTLDALNHPIFAWAEMESYRWTGDIERLRQVRGSLTAYYEALRKYLRQGNGLYMTDWASMDNSSRNPWLRDGGTAVDASSEMVLFARNLAEMAEALGLEGEAARLRGEADELARRIAETMWDPERRFFFDLTVDGKRAPVRTVAGFWTLIARVASPGQAKALAAHLRDPRTFGTPQRVPTLAADEPGFAAETGEYWLGSVWAPTTTMVVRGLEAYGERDLAREIALGHLRQVVGTFRETGTIWENYSPTRIAPGRPAQKDFVGWSGIAPIAFFIEYAIGIRAEQGRLVWSVRSPGRVGVDRLWVGGNTVSLLCEPENPAGERKVRVAAERMLRIKVERGERSRDLEVPAGGTVEFSL
jgi:glycogen debranching enzyme